MNHINTRLQTVAALKQIEEDEGQFDTNEKLTLRLPAAVYDVTDAVYGGSGKVGFANTEISVLVAFKLKDNTRFTVLDAVKKALVGSGFSKCSGLLMESQTKIRQTPDVRIYQLTFGTFYYDMAAVPVGTDLPQKPEAEFTTIRKV